MIVTRLKNFFAQRKTKVLLALIEENQPIIDDRQLLCGFSTSIHDPESRTLLPHNNEVYDIVDPLGLNQERVSNKQAGSTINFNERYQFFIDIRRLYRSNQRDIYLGIQVLEEQTEDKFALKCWNYVKLNYTNAGQIDFVRGDILNIETFLPERKNIPFDAQKQKKSELEVDLVLDFFEYDPENL